MEISKKLILVGCLVLIFTACRQEQKTNQNDQTAQKIEALIAQMTLEEKVNMIHASSSFTNGGVQRLGIPELVMSDGPHGVRYEHGRDWDPDPEVNDSATYLPTGITLASTWNPQLGYEFGAVLGREAKARGKNIILGPGVNIMRTPLNGRNFEYLSEDPYLAARMAVGYIKGVQDQGIAACVKHMAGNNQEIGRYSIDVNIDERTLREIYLPAFEAAVKEAGVLTVMGAYNKFRGEHCSHNSYLLNEILKGEWGFNGALISDWNAVHDTRQALLNGTDIEMGTDIGMIPNIDYNKFFLADSALALIGSGAMDEKVVDEKVRRILRVMFALNIFDERTPGAINTPEHQRLALQVAEEGIVLLKNDGFLPVDLMSKKTIAVIGDNASRKHALAGGSSQVNAKYEITFLDALQKAVTSEVNIKYAQGYTISKTHSVNEPMLNEAIETARNADLVFFVGGSFHSWGINVWTDNAYDAEDVDKPDMKLPFNQDQLINEILKVNPNTVVVLYGGGPVETAAWNKQARGILQAGYPGMEGGNALVNIVSGKVNPSGKLTVTFPKKLEDSPAHVFGEYPGQNGQVTYNEGIFVGYRYFDTYNIEPEYCFGHGLSYTQFGYTELEVSVEGKTVNLSFRVQNIGTFAGAEVAQVYVRDVESSVKRPEKELKAFEKVFLQPGESKQITLQLNADAFSFYDVDQKSWVLEPGEFELLIGSSSKDLRLNSRIEL